MFMSYIFHILGHLDKPLIKGIRNLVPMVEHIKNYLGPAPNVEALPDGSFAPVKSFYTFPLTQVETICL